MSEKLERLIRDEVEEIRGTEAKLVNVLTAAKECLRIIFYTLADAELLEYDDYANFRDKLRNMDKILERLWGEVYE